MFFKTAKRNIFVYHDGVKKRRVDPLVIWRELWSHERNLKQATQIRGDENPKISEEWRQEAFNDIVAITRDVFKIKPYDGETGKGLTEDETEGVFAQFATFMHQLKKNTDQTPNESQSSDSNGLDESTMPPESDYSSTSTPSKSDNRESTSTQSPRQSQETSDSIGSRH